MTLIPGSADYEVARISAIADLVMWQCPTCNVKREMTEVTAGEVALPKVIGITHEVSCPDFIQD